MLRYNTVHDHHQQSPSTKSHAQLRRVRQTPRHATARCMRALCTAQCVTLQADIPYVVSTEELTVPCRVQRRLILMVVHGLMRGNGAEIVECVELDTREDWVLVSGGLEDTQLLRCRGIWMDWCIQSSWVWPSSFWRVAWWVVSIVGGRVFLLQRWCSRPISFLCHAHFYHEKFPGPRAYVAEVSLCVQFFVGADSSSFMSALPFGFRRDYSYDRSQIWNRERLFLPELDKIGKKNILDRQRIRTADIQFKKKETRKEKAIKIMHLT